MGGGVDGGSGSVGGLGVRIVSSIFLIFIFVLVFFFYKKICELVKW